MIRGCITLITTAGSVSITLACISISDGNVVAAFAAADDEIIPSGGYLVLWADKSAFLLYSVGFTLYDLMV